MGPEITSESCFTCSKIPIHFHKIPDPENDLNPNISQIICQHFWFKEDDLRNIIICETCWEKVDQFHHFYQDVQKLHEHREVAPPAIFIKQEEIEIEETQIQDIFTDTSAENQKLFDIIDCKHEIKEESDELSQKEEPAEVPHLRNIKQYERCLPNNRDVKRNKPFLRTPKTLEERQAEDDFIKQHTRYICVECNIEFENFIAIKYHRVKTHSKDTVTCCGKQYRNRSILYQHVQSLFNPDAFKCEICGKSFKFKKGYVRHKEEAHAAEEKLVFKCNRCPSSFTTEGLLKRHLAEHETLENETAKCEFCGKCFRHKNVLNKHVKAVHTKPMNFICEVCSKGFHQRAMLLEHRKTHELTPEQLREQCPVCSKWLKNHTSWLLHTQRHKGGECKCEVCGHVSINLMSLKVHMKTRHAPDRKKHVCKQCGKEYSRAITLKEHVAIAHARQPLYQCEYCEKKFFWAATRNSHRRKNHPQEWLESQNATREEISVGGQTAS